MRKLRAAYAPLFAAYPVLFLFAHNVDRAFPSDLVLPLLAVLGGATVALTAGTKVLGDLDRAAVVVAAAGLLFLSYGQVYTRLEDVSLLGVSIGRDRFMLTAWTAASAAVVVFARRSRTVVSELAPTLNVVAVVLIALPLATTATYALSSSYIFPNELEPYRFIRVTDRVRGGG